MRAAEESPSDFHSMTDDGAPAFLAAGRNRLDGAFEAIEGMAIARRHQLKALVVFVLADLARSHKSSCTAQIRVPQQAQEWMSGRAAALSAGQRRWGAMQPVDANKYAGENRRRAGRTALSMPIE